MIRKGLLEELTILLFCQEWGRVFQADKIVSPMALSREELVLEQ